VHSHIYFSNHAQLINDILRSKEEEEKKRKKNRHLLASRKIMVRDAIAGGVSVPPLTGGYLCVSTLMMNIYMPMRNDPAIKDHRRPMRSTRKSRKNAQLTILHTPKKPLSRRAFCPAPTAWKTWGETKSKG
jgi:hypothetical protein